MSDSRVRNILSCVVYAAIVAGVATAVAIPVFRSSGILREGKVVRQKRVVRDLKESAEALRAFRQIHGGFPTGTWPQVTQRLIESRASSSLALVDPHGVSYEYRAIGPVKNRTAQHFVLRAAGEDREFESTPPSGPFDPRDFHRDIVVGDDFFLQWPQKIPPPTSQDATPNPSLQRTPPG